MFCIVQLQFCQVVVRMCDVDQLSGSNAADGVIVVDKVQTNYSVSLREEGYTNLFVN